MQHGKMMEHPFDDGGTKNMWNALDDELKANECK
jgi:hypothetical protein